MNKRPSLSQWIVLAAAGGASFYGAIHLATPSAEDASEPVVFAASARTIAPDTIVTPAPPPVTGPPPREAIEVGSAAETFRGTNWAPPPPPAPVAVAAARTPPPPPPGPPPLPFRFVGMLEQQSDQPTAFLAKGEALHVIRVGDVIDSVYQVESLSPTQVVLTYLPLKQRQTIGVAGGQP